MATDIKKNIKILESVLGHKLVDTEFTCRKNNKGIDIDIKGILKNNAVTIIKKGSIVNRGGKYVLTDDEIYDLPSKAIDKCIESGRRYWQTEFREVNTGEGIGKYYLSRSAANFSAKNKEAELKKIYDYWRERLGIHQHIYYADKAGEANILTEEGQQQQYNIALKAIEDTKKKELEEQEKLLKDLTYEFDPYEPYTDIPLIYNIRKVNDIMEKLKTNFSVYIHGKSDSGKTYLSKVIAGRFIGVNTINLSHNIKKYENLLWIKTGMNQAEFLELFAKFCTHNQNSEKCMVVFNEAEKSKFEDICPIWDEMKCNILKNEVTFTYKGEDIKIPKGLRILANAVTETYAIREQMENRFDIKEDLDDISKDDIEEIYNYTGINKGILNIMIEIQNERVEKLNDKSERFICIYHLKIKPLDVIEECIRKPAYGPRFEEMKNKLKEYANTLKNGEKYAI